VFGLLRIKRHVQMKTGRRTGEGRNDAGTVLAERELLWHWQAGHSLARGSPLPVPDRGGMRVDTASPDEFQRFVFPGPDPRIRDIAASVLVPRTFIKMCGPGDRLRAMAPAGWLLQPAAYLMTQGGADDPPVRLPPGYRLELSEQGPRFTAMIFSEDQSLAASGHAAEFGSAFVFDRISTNPAHRRRGLGGALMSSLGAMRTSSGARRVLVATEDGRALYSSLGWTVISLFSTIVLPEPGQLT
jgi:GNAT superfamily N-acetyltransferase